MTQSLNRSALRVRPATVDDLAFVIAQAPRMLEFGPPPWRDKSIMVDADQRILTEALLNPRDDSAFFIAESAKSLETDRQPLGFVHVTTHHDYFTGEAHGHIGDIAVAKEAEGQGVGKALMAVGEAWSREQGYRLLTLNVFAANQRAIAVYEKAGFEVDTIKYLKRL